MTEQVKTVIDFYFPLPDFKCRGHTNFNAKIVAFLCQNVTIWALKNKFKNCSKVHRKEKDRFILNNYKGECPSRSFAL